MDFSSLLSGLAEEVKRKPNKKPDVLPLPSEQAIGEVVGGAEQELATQASEPSQGAPMQGSPLGLGEQQLRATEQGIADEPANADNVYQTVDTSKVDKLARVEGANRPDMSQLIPLTDVDRTAMTAPIEAPVANRTPRKLSLDEQIAQGEQVVRDATDAPIQKQSFWKDLGAKLIQGADAFFNGNRAPIHGWGRLKHDQAIQNANAKLNPLLAQRKQQQESDYVKARTDAMGTEAERDKAYVQYTQEQKERQAKIDAQKPIIDKEKAYARKLEKWTTESSRVNTQRNEVASNLAGISSSLTNLEAEKSRAEAELKKASRPADRNRIKTQIKSYTDKIIQANSKATTLRESLKGLTDPKKPSMDDKEEVEINEPLMQSIRATAPQGATEEQINAAYQKALALRQ